MSGFSAGSIAFGAFVVLFGLQVFFKPRWYAPLRSTYMDFSGYHHFWGIVWILAGSLFIWLSIRQRTRSKEKERQSKGGKGET
jgi:hypothetical protein